MSDTVFRSQQTPAPTESLPKGKTTDRSGDETKIEVPYLDYEQENGKPYIADHFQLGETWDDVSGGFEKEVDIIESYLQDKITNGEIANNVSVIKDILKGIEKTTNIAKETRPIIKIETIAAYIEFLNKTDKLKANVRRYASS